MLVIGDGSAKVHLPPPLAAPLNAAKERSIAQLGPSVVIGILAGVRAHV
jgi:hypothetical protein